jgi:hypothetical protein
VLVLNRALEQASGVSLLNDSQDEIRRDRRRRAKPLPGALTRTIKGQGGDIPRRQRVHPCSSGLYAAQRDHRATYPADTCAIHPPASAHAVHSDDGCVVLAI